MFTKVFALDRFFIFGAAPKMTFLFSIAYDPETVNLFTGADGELSGEEAYLASRVERCLCC